MDYFLIKLTNNISDKNCKDFTKRFQCFIIKYMYH